MAGRGISLEVAPSIADPSIGDEDQRSRLHAVPAFENASAESDPRLLELEATYTLRRPQVIRFLLQYGLDLVEAEDITQEVFLNVLRTPGRERAADHFFHWLLACAKNMAINRQRRGKREVLAPAALWKRWEETLGDPAPDVVLVLEERERFERFHQALSRLTATEQEAVLLRSQGSTFREIAAALDLPLRSAIYTTGTALQKLQRMLKNA